jgi:hypothetical protein
MCQLIAANCICDPITETIWPIQSSRKSRWRRDENAVCRWTESGLEAGKGSVDDIRDDAIIVALSIFDNEPAKDQILQMRFTIIHSLRVALLLGLLTGSALACKRFGLGMGCAPATIRGLVGGEANDTYVVQVRKGRQLTVEISWKKEDDNTASFGMGASKDLEPISFGKESNGGRKWVGKVPKTGDYFIEVVAHPRAHYVLKVRIK